MSDRDADAGQTQLGDPPEASPALEYRDLAWWAEKADGAEGENLVLAFIEKTKKVVLETEDEAKQTGHRTILKGIKVPKAKREKEKPVEEILIKVKGKEPIPAKIDGLVCDAVFSSASAMRKFVILYYETHRILDNPRWKKLMKAIDDPQVPAIGHVHPSVSGAIGTGSDLWLLKQKKVGTQLVEEWVSLDKYEPSKEPRQP